MVYLETDPGDNRGKGALAVHPESLAVSAAEADEVPHKTALVLEQVGDEHCVESKLDVSEQADLRMSQHLEYT